jgi:molybdopterin synthase sulfur carrier subunit
MSIKIHYFAGLKEILGRAGDEIDPTGISTANGVWHKANPNKIIPPNTLVAINMVYVNLHAHVKDGDEVAFFPPVTGG